MSRRLENKLAVVTASTAGIGLAIVERFLEEGALVILSSRKEKNVNAAVTHLKLKGFGSDRVRGIVCAVTKRDHRQEMLQFSVKAYPSHPSIDILVSNAACSPFFGITLATPEAAFDKLFEVNVKASFLLISEASSLLTDGASVLLVSSYLAFNPTPPLAIYGVTKTALLGLTKALAYELGKLRNIRVNCLAPGFVKTDFSKALWDTKDGGDIISSQTTLGRFAESTEMAGPAVFLCSSDASYITGECLVAAAGAHSRL